MTLTIEDVDRAYARIAPIIRRTPLLSAPLADQWLCAKVYVKCENLQITGAFKYRGATNKILQADLSIGDHVVAFSSGNHAQAVAFAAQARGLACTIIMPSDAPTIKMENTKSYGAKVVVYDRWKQDRTEIAKGEMTKTSLLIPPFDDYDVMAGQGTAAIEILEEIEPDALIAPAGGGGLIAGLSTVMKARMPSARVYAAEPAGYDDLARSLKSGHLEKNTSTEPSLCDAIVTPSPGELTFPILQRNLDGVDVVDDENILAAMRFLSLHYKLVVEPGGAAGFAALMRNRARFKGQTVAIVLSGGNVDSAVFQKALRS